MTVTLKKTPEEHAAGAHPESGTQRTSPVPSEVPATAQTELRRRPTVKIPRMRRVEPSVPSVPPAPERRSRDAVTRETRSQEGRKGGRTKP